MLYFCNKIGTYPVTTTTKSIMFHMLRKYDPLCKTNPSATTLKSASMQKIPKKYTSVSSCKHNGKNIKRRKN